MIEADRVATIILGGGVGKRLFPLTQYRCKPAVPFGQGRLIDIPLSNAINAHLRSIFIITQFLSASLHRHLHQTWRLDPFGRGFIQLLSPEQKLDAENWYHGTADAVRQNKSYLSETPADYFLILSGDQLYHFDFQELFSFAKKTDADLVVAALPTGDEDVRRMGVLKVDSDGAITDFVEKPEDPTILENLKTGGDKPWLGSMGIYLFKRKALFDLLDQDPRADFGSHLIPTQIKRGKTFAFRFEGYWADIGTIDSFHKANMALTGRETAFDFYSRPLYFAPLSLPPAKIMGGLVKNSLFSPGCLVEAGVVENSVLGPRTVIGPGSQIKNSVLFGNDFYNPPSYQSLPQDLMIDEGCEIENAIIDKHAYIGKGVKLINRAGVKNCDGNNFFIRDGIIVVPRGAHIQSGFSL